MSDLVIIESNNLRARAFLIMAMIVVLVFGWFAVRWQIGDLVARITPASDPNAAVIADFAISWAPSDPAGFTLKAVASNDTSASLTLFEGAVRHSPFDYRLRTALGRAYEQGGQIERGEAELRHAVELAPTYSSPRWHLGNFLLRRERTADAVAELKVAAENNQTYRDQVFSLAWDYFNKDASQMRQFAGERPDLIARLAYFFAARGRAEDSLANWNRLTQADKESNAVLARAIGLGLFDQKRFSQALEFMRQYGAEPDAYAEAITNPSFETVLDDGEESRFGWRIARNESRFDATADSKVKRDGNRSLRMTFRTFNKPTFTNVFQTVVVEPGKKYILRFWVRTEGLKSLGGPMLEILNANDDRTIARTVAFPMGTNDWQEMTVEFTSPENCNAINLRTIRAVCGEDCPLTGIFWYDDFEIRKQ